MWLFYGLMLYILAIGLLTGFLRESKKIYLFFTLGMLGFLAAFRGRSIGNDTSVYLEIFSDSPTINLSIFDARFEAGYILLNKGLNYISTNPQIILIASSAIIMYGFYKFIKDYSKIPWISVFLFFTLGYWGQTMNTIRQNIAIVIILYSYNLITKKKLLPFVLMVIVASLFHRTAIIFLLAYPLARLKLNLKTIFLFFLTAIGGFLFFNPLLNAILSIFPIYQYYLGGVYLNGEVRIATIMNILVASSILIFGQIIYHQNNKFVTKNLINVKQNSEPKYSNEHIFSLFILTGIVIEFISLNFNLLNRVGMYFAIFSIVYIPNRIKSIKDKNLNAITQIIIVALFFIYATVIQTYRPDWNVIYPYQFFWQK